MMSFQQQGYIGDILHLNVGGKRYNVINTFIET